VADAQSLWSDAMAQQLAAGKFRVEMYATVQGVFQVREMSVLERLAGEHILSADTIRQRFEYRQPGLFVLAIRAFRVPQAFEVSDSPYLAGCKSWVELPESHSTNGAKPVIEDTAFSERLAKIAALVSQSLGRR
jgi:hypothetical protein